jgi:hypothetical protein
MHFFAAVLIPNGADAQPAAEQAMAPYCEYDGDNGWWDWWQIGGRWTGVWSEYDPSKDPENFEDCFLCKGTPGMRMDWRALEWRAKNPEYTCNGCASYGYEPGRSLKHPSHWVKHEFDVIPARSALRLIQAGAQKPYRFVAGEQVGCTENWTGKEFVKIDSYEKDLIDALREHANTHHVVVVDYHT